MEFRGKLMKVLLVAILMIPPLALARYKNIFDVDPDEYPCVHYDADKMCCCKHSKDSSPFCYVRKQETKRNCCGSWPIQVNMKTCVIRQTVINPDGYSVEINSTMDPSLALLNIESSKTRKYGRNDKGS